MPPAYVIKPKAFTAVPGVSVQDELGQHTETVRLPRRLCVPADKRDEDPTAPADIEHLIGHDVSAPNVRKPNQVVVNQLGTVTIDVIRPDVLLVPTLKTLNPPPPPLAPPAVDHFQCYKVKRSRGAAPFTKIVGVKVDDQFGTAMLDLLRPHLLCAPANVQNGDPTAPGHPDICCATARGTRDSARYRRSRTPSSGRPTRCSSIAASSVSRR